AALGPANSGLQPAPRRLGHVHPAVHVDDRDLAQEVAGCLHLPAQLPADELRVAQLYPGLDHPAVQPVPAQLTDRHLRECGRQLDLVLAGGLWLRAAACTRAQLAISAAAGDADDPARSHDRAALFALQPDRAGQHALAADPAGLVRLPVLHLPAASVLYEHPARTGRRGADRWRLDFTDLHQCHPAALTAGAGNGGDLRVHRQLEQPARPADLHPLTGIVHAGTRVELVSWGELHSVQLTHGGVDHPAAAGTDHLLPRAATIRPGCHAHRHGWALDCAPG